MLKTDMNHVKQFLPGWEGLYNKMCEELNAVENINICVLEAKEKFGEMRVSVGIEHLGELPHEPDPASDYRFESAYDQTMLIIDKYTQLSKTICERCGANDAKIVQITQFGFLACRCNNCLLSTLKT